MGWGGRMGWCQGQKNRTLNFCVGCSVWSRHTHLALGSGPCVAHLAEFVVSFLVNLGPITAACDTLAASNAVMASHPVPRKHLLSLSWTHSWLCLATPQIQSLAWPLVTWSFDTASHPLLDSEVGVRGKGGATPITAPRMVHTHHLHKDIEDALTVREAPRESGLQRACSTLASFEFGQVGFKVLKCESEKAYFDHFYFGQFLLWTIRLRQNKTQKKIKTSTLQPQT